MNEIIKSLFDRKSMRDFQDKNVDKDTVKLLLEATLQAPTAGNQILYSIINITDQNLKNKLAVTCDNQPFIAKAPLVFVFVADHTRWHKSFEITGSEPRKLGVGDLFLAITDTAIAAQNMVVAAESLGLGSCYIGDILENCEEHRSLLNLPKNAVPVCMLVLGYPTERQLARKKPARFDIKYIVGENSYPHLSDEELEKCCIEQQKLDEKTEIRAFAEYMRAFCKRKFNSDFSREMTRSVGEYLKEFENND